MFPIERTKYPKYTLCFCILCVNFDVFILFIYRRKDFSMLNYQFLLSLVFIIISTKLLGLVSRKVHMPQVVGALLAGLILGSSILNVVGETSFIQQTSEIGVIVILFLAGLETNLTEIRRYLFEYGFIESTNNRSEY